MTIRYFYHDHRFDRVRVVLFQITLVYHCRNVYPNPSHSSKILAALYFNSLINIIGKRTMDRHFKNINQTEGEEEFLRREHTPLLSSSSEVEYSTTEERLLSQSSTPKRRRNEENESYLYFQQSSSSIEDEARESRLSRYWKYWSGKVVGGKKEEEEGIQFDPLEDLGTGRYALFIMIDCKFLNILSRVAKFTS